MKFDFTKIKPPNFGRPIKIYRVVEKMIEQSVNMNIPQTNYQEEAVQKFRFWLYHNGAPLSIKEKRHLSWALNMGKNKILANKSETSEALSFYQQNTMNLSVTGILKGLIYSYFFAYDVPRENIELLRSRIRLLLLQYQGRNSTIHHWASLANDIFGSKPEESVAKMVLNRQNITFYETLQNLKIPLESSFYRNCIKQLTLSYSSDSVFPHRLAELFKVIESINDIEVLKKCIDYILQGFVQRDIKELHDESCSFCIRHLGDPRLRRNVKWNGISNSSKDLVVRWLSTEDLTIFFDLVAMDRDRKNFWLTYVDIIEYSRVIFGQDALSLGNVEIKKFLSQKRHAELRNCPRTLSAFILKIKDTVIVEFSHTGNACYIYRANKVPFTLDSKTYSKKDLANMFVVDERMKHFTGWEDKFRGCLFEKYNIRQPRRNQR